MAVLESALQPRTDKSSKLLTVALPIESSLPESQRELEELSTTLGESEVFELLEENASIANVRKAMQEYSLFTLLVMENRIQMIQHKVLFFYLMVHILH